MTVRPQVVYLWTALAWLAGFSAHAATYVVGVLSLPPTDEVYAASVPFQLTAFVYSWGGLWLGGILVALLIEFVTLGRRRK